MEPLQRSIVAERRWTDFRSAPALAFLLTLFCCPLSQAEDVELLLLRGRTNHATVTQLDSGIYEITTTGDDPYIFFKPEPATYDPGVVTALSFDYFSLDGLDSCQFFFGPRISEQQSVNGDALIPTEGWLSYSIDIHSSPASTHWTTPTSIFRLDFGRRKGKTIQIRNVRLRPPTGEEARSRREKAEKEARVAEHNARLGDYLETAFSSRVEKVVVGRKGVTVSGHGAGSDLWLYESPAWNPTYRAPVPSDGRQIKGGTFSVTLPRLDADGRDRVYSRWFVGSKDGDGILRQSHEVYATDLTALPPEEYTDKPFGGIKGIGGIHLDEALYPDLVDLGVQHIRVLAVMHSFLKLKPGRDTEPFLSQGRTYYANRDQLRRFDRLLRFADEHDMHVAVVLLLRPSLPDPEEQNTYNHPDTVSPGKYSMANVTTREGFEAYCAFIELLASRYCRPDRTFGRITHWIVHNEVDSGWIWTNIGKKPSLLYMHDYVRALRATQTAVRQYSPTGKAFISLTHCWGEPHIDNGLFYTGSETMDHLLAFCRAEGDFEWGIALHPYPRDLRDPLTTWQPAKSEFSFDTPMITFYNIEVIDAYARRSDVCYRGKTVRSVILSEQGFNSPDYSDPSLRNQAAALAYGWKKIKSIPSVEAFHYHRWIDHAHEGGLNLGLWTVRPGTVTTPDEKKPSHGLFQALETPEEDEACRFALEVIGLEAFPENPYQGEIE